MLDMNVIFIWCLKKSKAYTEDYEMIIFIWFLITITVGLVGGLVALKLKIPVGGILGSMLAVIILNIVSGDKAVFYEEVKVIIQLFVGATIGCKVGRSEIKGFKKLFVPILIIFPMMLVYNLIFGTLIYKTGELDIFTSFYSVTPGGITDIAIIAEEMGADAGVVGVVHAIRVLICSVLLPPLFVAFSKKKSKGEKSKGGIVEKLDRLNLDDEDSKPDVLKTVRLFAISAIGGLLFKHFGIKGGAIIGSMAFAIVCACIWGKCYIPKVIKKYQQIYGGIYIGSGVTVTTILAAKDLVLPIIILIIDILVGTFLSTFLIVKTKKLDTISAMGSCSPGGMTEVMLVTDELGGDASTVGIIHLFRMFFIVSCFPPIINFVISLI